MRCCAGSAYRTSSAVITRRYLPAFSKLSFALFDLQNCVDVPRSKTKQIDEDFTLFRGGGIVGVLRKPCRQFGKLAGKKSEKTNATHR